MGIGRREYLAAFGTGSLAALAGCNEVSDGLKNEIMPEPFNTNRYFTEQNQEQTLRDNGYDEFIDPNTTVQFMNIDGILNIDSVDLATQTRTLFDEKYSNIGDYLGVLSHLEARRDLGGAFAEMIFTSIGIYAAQDPVAEDADVYQEAMNEMRFEILGNDGYGVGVHLDAQEVDHIEHLFDEHGATTDPTGAYVLGYAQQNMQAFDDAVEYYDD